MLPYDVIVTDLDGTLLTDAKTISPGTLEALEAARASGVTWMLASARPEMGLRHLAEKFGINLDGLMLCSCNGAVVSEADTGKVIAETTVPDDVVKTAVELADSLGVAVITMSGDTVYATRADGYHVEREGPANGMKTVITPTFDGLNDLPKLEISCPPDQMPTVRKELDKVLSPIAETALSSPWYYEVTATGVTKGAALTAYANARGVDVRRIIAFGDQENDISMIQAAGTGVAMGNGAEALKAVADFVTKDNDEDGIPFALAKFGVVPAAQ